MAETIIPGRAAPTQGPSRDSRVKDDGSAGGAQGGDEESFRNVISNLADRADAKRSGAVRSGGKDNGSQDGDPRSTEARSADSDDVSGDVSTDTSAAVANALAALQSGPSLLEQMALALAQTALSTTPSSDGGETAAAAATTGTDQGALAASLQLLSSLAASDSSATQVGPAVQTDPAAAALAALGGGGEEVAFPDLGANDAALASLADDLDEMPVTKVTVAGQETHFSPVQSAESTLSRLLGGPVAITGASPADADQGAAPADGQGTASKDSTAIKLGDAVATRPVAMDGESGGARDGREGSSGERRSQEGQAPTGATDQQGVRSAGMMGDLQSTAASGGTEPADATSPGMQIARKIASEIASPASRLAVTSSGPDGAIKVLHLQLEPANLGSVTVRISLKDNVINLQVEASRHETAFAIEKDREVLSNALKQAGYVVDNITAQPAGPMRTTMQAQPVSNDGQMSSSLQSQADSQSGLAQSGRGNQGDGGGRQGPDRAGASGGVNEGRKEGSHASSGGLYV